jgi:cell division protein FtsX
MFVSDDINTRIFHRPLKEMPSLQLFRVATYCYIIFVTAFLFCAIIQVIKNVSPR